MLQWDSYNDIDVLWIFCLFFGLHISVGGNGVFVLCFRGWTWVTGAGPPGVHTCWQHHTHPLHEINRSLTHLRCQIVSTLQSAPSSPSANTSATRCPASSVPQVSQLPHHLHSLSMLNTTQLLYLGLKTSIAVSYMTSNFRSTTCLSSSASASPSVLPTSFKIFIKYNNFFSIHSIVHPVAV